MPELSNLAHSLLGIGPVLVLGAHPDDAVLGAGGIAAQIVRLGGRVIFITATLGELGGEAQVRRLEDLRAARTLGVEWHCGQLRDGEVSQREAMGLVEDSIRRFNPRTVFVHAPRDSHQDHVNLSRAGVAACRFVANLFFFEGPTSQRFWPSLVTDISSVWNLKSEALLAHQSQLERTSLMEWSDAVSRFRAWPRFRGCRCEGFRVHHCEFTPFESMRAERNGAAKQGLAQTV